MTELCLSTPWNTSARSSTLWADTTCRYLEWTDWLIETWAILVTNTSRSDFQTNPLLIRVETNAGCAGQKPINSYVRHQTINRLTNQPTDQSANWPINQLTYLPTVLLTDRSTDWPISQLTKQPIDLSTHWPTDWPTYRLTVLPTDHPTDLPIFQPTDPPTDQSTDDQLDSFFIHFWLFRCF